MRARDIFITTSVAALTVACGLAQAEPMDHGAMDHSSHGAVATGAAQWVDPGKAQAQGGPAAEAPKGESPKADEHAGHHGGGGMMGGMGGMGGMMGGGMGHGGAGGGMDHGSGGGMGAMMNKMMCGFADHVDGRLAYLKAELRLTDQQLTAWNNFADAWRATAQKAQSKCAAMDERPDNSKPPVINKLNMMERHMSDHLDIVRAQKAAIEPLFTALSDEQKKIASEALTHVMKVGHSMMGGGGMVGGMGGMGGGMMGGMGGDGGMQH